jgi:Cof subfamily protein (haloacid dehalogenase superfamily)
VPAKLLALDLDGTLLRKDGSIDPIDLAAIARVQRQGVIVTIATGRMYGGTKAAAHVIAVNGPVACVDGSSIVDSRDDRIHLRRTISSSVTHNVLSAFDEHQLATFAFCDDAIVHNGAGAFFARYVATWSPNLLHVEKVSVDALLDAGHQHDVLATLAVGSAEQIAAASAVAAANQPLFSVQFAISHSASERRDLHALLLRADGYSKGTAVAALCEYHNVSIADSVVIGDWLNDVSMFRVAGRSFAMAGAPPEVAHAASDRLRSLAAHGGGVAEAIDIVWPT